MSEYIPKFTSGTRAAQEERVSSFTDSYAKKFITPDAVQNNSTTDSTDNAEHLVNLASGMRTLALGASALAQQAQIQIAAAISGVFQVDGEIDPQPQPAVEYTEDDVNSVQARLIDLAAQAYVNIEDPTTRDQVIRQIGQHVYNARHAFVPIREEDMTVRTTNNVVPVVESAEVDIDKNKGATDNFYVGLTFNLPASASDNISLIRIFRADIADPIYTRPLPTISSNGIQRLHSFRGVKNDSVTAGVVQLDQNGVPNAVSLLNYVNPFTGQRVSAQGDQSLVVPNPLPNQKSSPNLDVSALPDALSHLDRSVASNINVLFNLQNNPVLGLTGSARQEALQVGRSRVSGSWYPLLIDASNKLEFREIGHFTPGGSNTRHIGGLLEYYYEDSTVTYGGGYKYFIVTVNDKAVQSARSSIIDVTVEGLRIPPKPTTVVPYTGDKFVTLMINATDQLIEKFEIYRMDPSPNAATQALAQTISDQQGFSIGSTMSNVNDNGFLHIGECFNSVKSGGTFMDSSATPGKVYTYRVYSVDVFGNKSEVPYEVEAFIPDLTQQYVALQKPALLAEVDSATHKMKLTFSCNDTLVERLNLERMDLTSGETTFSVPQARSRIIFGYGRSPIKNRPSMSGEMIFNPSAADVWSGVFDNSGPQSFIDLTVQYDHVYQYRIYGEDRYGNKTDYVISSPLMIVRHPFINEPTQLSASVSLDNTGFLQGVNVHWMPGTQDVSAGDLLGNQNALTSSLVRTLYQLQRRHTNEDTWQSFPLTAETSILDQMDEGLEAPKFRPPFLTINQSYQYRVTAIQTGSFISNYTDPVQVFVGYNVATPTNFTLRMPAATARPFYIMLNWDTPDNSGVVDYWEIQRCPINNIAAAQLNTQNPDSFAKLTYNPYRLVYSESSRFSSKATDSLQMTGSVNSLVLVGMHYFMDTAVDFGNTYFYRIRAVSPEGQQSAWVYRGAKVTSAAFEQKYMALISDDEKQELASSQLPLVPQQIQKLGVSSYSMVPPHAQPLSIKSSNVVIYKGQSSKTYNEEYY